MEPAKGEQFKNITIHGFANTGEAMVFFMSSFHPLKNKNTVEKKANYFLSSESNLEE